MTKSLRHWWQNCALLPDDEILAIDQMEDRIATVSKKALKIRELISGLELCHHKADRWIINIIEAIGTGETKKGLGTRSIGQLHPVETVWQNSVAALSAWCAGYAASSVEITIGSMPASQLLASLGERSPLKEWQVQRVIDKIRSVIHWPRAVSDPSAQYVWILLGGGEYESFYRNKCPVQYSEHEDFWLQTVRTLIHDTESGKPANLSLGLAIDMLWPCHWGFVKNLGIVLGAIGGQLYPEKPFAACGRNISLLPGQRRLKIISNTLRVFFKTAEATKSIDRKLWKILGKKNHIKAWLSASLDKTIRLQLNPPDDLRAVSAMSGPDWIQS